MALAPDSNDLYREYLGFLINTTMKLRKRYRLHHLEWEECLSLANMGFVHALQGFDPSRGELGPRIARKIEDEFCQKVKELRRHGGVVPVSLVEDFVDPKSLRRGFVPADMASKSDATYLIRLALVCPDNVYEAAVNGCSGQKHVKASHIIEGFRRVLREKLQQAGWNPWRVEAAYREVREVIA